MVDAKSKLDILANVLSPNIRVMMITIEKIPNTDNISNKVSVKVIVVQFVFKYNVLEQANWSLFI